MTYGCHNRSPYRESYKVQDGYFAAGYERIDKMIAAKHVMTTDCQYTKTHLGQIDSRCDGCKWRVSPSLHPQP